MYKTARKINKLWLFCQFTNQLKRDIIYNVSGRNKAYEKNIYFTKEENIMTTYKNITYETAEALRAAINSELETLAYPYLVRHKIYGEGQLTFVKAPASGGSIYATIDFMSGTKMLALDVVFATQMLTMPDTLTDTLLEAQTAFKEDFTARTQAQREAERLAQEQAREAAEKAEEEKRAEAKYKQQKESVTRAFDNLIACTNTEPSDTDEFYYALGWLAKHAGTVSATLPDYLENAFIQHFGPETQRRVLDSKKRYPSGWTAQWAWSFTISLKKPKKLGVIPALLSDKLNPTGKMVSDTSFVWDLVDNYGFQFSKTQDIDKIRSHVPASCLAAFEAGLA